MAEIINAVKNHLDITWDDPDSDKKLSGIIERGKRYIDDISGNQNNYEDSSSKAFELLLEYVRYVRCAAFDKFAINYRGELLSLQISERVKRLESEEEQQSADIQ
nr:MAG TPA: Head Tail Connector Protein [Caudoviricetes sp.]